MTFRVHFSDGVKIDVEAADSKSAQREATAQHPTRQALVTKVKLVRA